MSEPTQEEVISVVSSIFDVSDMELTLELLKFKIDDKEFKSKFVYLAQKLEERDLVCRLQKKHDEMYILVTRFPPRKPRKWLSASWTPRLLFSIVIVFVMIDGYFRTEATNSIVNIGDPLEIAGIYTLSLLGILGIHESGHLVAAKLHKLKTSWPYFIPGIPVYGIPTFGAVITSRGLTVNRHILFDVAIAGPIAGLVIAVIVAIYGAATAPVLDEQLAQELFSESRLLEFNEPILMQAALSMFGKGGDQEVLLTPVLFAAWLGFFITFVNLLPAWQLDGGHMARALFGQKWHRIGTYASIAILFWPLKLYLMAMFILLLSSRNPSAMPLDDVSPLPNNRKIMYVVVIILAILCAPLPGGGLF
jgi:membrane-associated protease RseP (regulator of RpoE activity)